ncbi:cysteine-rich protein 2-binding protein [Patella vulgata]|uniref:cysteine-rich protein 2-binding protein n=1 Tax=Patella vulgata TaxID=6465 RepID=UPI00217FCF99|nr:cysteine-rich protein 2-binding protein [Patella vulgata]
MKVSYNLEPERPSFLNRLVGTEDDQLLSIRSPYTARILKPFIRRDYESRPLKMRLLEEIKAYPHRNDPTWKAPPPPPIDYCYVRPQHIPSVNVLCQQFFWPGIDLSECLHYPDFTCVVLFRKIVIGFAFMVPDVKYNEAYISFIFTHPEWRRAGIAKFMVYHLIQTCMGKDVTLHVSATNPGMLLYQKFGFKPEEFLLDFYDKYYPLDSKECKHAFFLRLRK